MFIEGKSFPSGTLQGDRHRNHVYDIVNGMVEAIDDMLAFDPVIFLQVFVKIFSTDVTLRYLRTQKEWQARNPH